MEGLREISLVLVWAVFSVFGLVFTLPQVRHATDALQRLHDLRAQLADEVLEPEYQGNFYRLLGAYRGSSEALLDFAQLCDKVDWTPWFEERFA